MPLTQGTQIFLLGRAPPLTSNFLGLQVPLFGSYLPFVVLAAISANATMLAVAWRKPWRRQRRHLDFADEGAGGSG